VSVNESDDTTVTVSRHTARIARLSVYANLEIARGMRGRDYDSTVISKLADAYRELTEVVYPESEGN